MEIVCVALSAVAMVTLVDVSNVFVWVGVCVYVCVCAGLCVCVYTHTDMGWGGIMLLGRQRFSTEL